MPSPYPYQVEGVQQALAFYQRGNHGVLLADDMGLGKTAQALMIAERLQAQSVLVVCPSSVKLNWLRECDVWLEKDPALHLISGRGCKAFTPGFDLYEVVNYDLLTYTDFSECDYDLVIYDEAHYMKTPESQRTIGGAMIRSARRLMLTGTPIQNRPKELWQLLILCGVVRAQDFHLFGLKYCAAWRGFEFRSVGSKKNGTLRTEKKEVWNYDGASNLEELNYWVRQMCMIRRMKADVMSDLPELTRQMIELDSSYTPKPYDASKLDDDIQVAFEEYSLVRHEEAVALIPQFIEMVENELRCTDKLFVAFYHRDVGEAVRDAFFGEISVVWGGLTPEQKQERVDHFISDPNMHVFLGQINACGTGTDGLQRVCSNMLVLEFPWDPGTRDQLESRLDRNGQTMPVLVRYLVHNGSLSARIAKTILHKEGVINKAVNQ